MLQAVKNTTKKSNPTIRIIAFVCALLTPFAVFYGLLTGLAGLAYDVPHAAPTPLQSTFSKVFIIMYIIFLILGPLGSVLAIVLSSMGLGGKVNYNKFVFTIVFILVFFVVSLWLVMSWSIPPTI